MISISRSTPAVVGTVNNLAVDFASIIHLRTKGTGDATITGIVAPADNFQCVLRNDSAVNAITLSANSSGSLAANRFRVASDVVLDPGDTCQLYYDVIGGGWNIITTTSGGGGFGLPITEANVTNLTADLAAKVTNNSNQDVSLNGNVRLLGPVALGFAKPARLRPSVLVTNADPTIVMFDGASFMASDQNDLMAFIIKTLEDMGAILPIIASPSLALFARQGLLWKDDAATIPVTAAGDRIAVWNSAINGLPSAIQTDATKRPVLALDDNGDWEIRPFDNASFMTLTTEIAFAADYTLWAVGTETNYSTVFRPYGGTKDYAQMFSDNQTNISAGNGAAAVSTGAIIKGKLITRWRRAAGNAYFAGHGSSGIPAAAIVDVLMGALAGTTTFNQILVGMPVNNGISTLLAYPKDCNSAEQEKNEMAIYGIVL